MKILEVADFNDPYRRVLFVMKGEVPMGWEEDNSRLPEVGERVCLYSTDDMVPFGCLAHSRSCSRFVTGRSSELGWPGT